MSIQAIFNEQAISMMPLVSAAIDSADSFSANQMRFRTLLEMSNMCGSYVDEDVVTREKFQLRLLQVFREKGWIDV